MSEVVREVNIAGLKKHITGKVRDVYDLGDTLLLVASDRLSAFDVVLPGGIPDKGRVLTQISLFWFEKTRHIVQNHVVTADSAEITSMLRDGFGVTDASRYGSMLNGRAMLGRKAEAVPIECVVRGYLSGSAWKEYQELATSAGASGRLSLHGVTLPADMVESQRLPEPVFTPATKASTGHDINISADQARDIAGKELVDELERLSLAIYSEASAYALRRGIIISDTKFEFGIVDDGIILIDELLTPDSSRFWSAADYTPGEPQHAYDKQFVRDYLLTLDWDKTYPGPILPQDIIEKTRERYLDAYRRIVGQDLPST